MTVRIDSSEVLHHLNNYGIYSIDDEALKSFMKDLKKLIKSEQYRNLYDANSERRETLGERNIADSTAKVELSNSSIPENRREKYCCRKKEKENIRPVYAEEPTKNKRIHYEESTHFLEPQRSEPSIPTSPKSSCNCKHRLAIPKEEKCKIHVDKNKEELCNVTRPASLLSCARSQTGSFRNKKGHCDPVELYHYYQSFWKNHKLPGENDHAQLRLAIRKRFMNVK